MRSTHLALIICFGLIVGCVEEGQRLPAIQFDTLADGRVAVHNSGETGEKPDPEWVLDRVARIGSVDGPESEVFGRIVDVEMGPEGHVYVLDFQTDEVRVFDLEGSHIRTLGGSGEGPGEIGGGYAITFDEGGNLWVADGTNRRYTVYSTEGEVVVTLSSPFVGGRGRGLVRASRDGDVFDVDVTERGLSVLRLKRESGELVVADTLPLGFWSPPGFTHTTPEGEDFLRRPPFGPRRYLDVSAEGYLWTGTSDEYAIHKVVSPGDTVRSVYRDVEPTPLTQPHRDVQQEWAEEAREGGFTGGDEELPMTYPYFSQVSVAQDGRLWVYRESPEGPRFDVFHPNGPYVGSAVTTLDGGVRPHVTDSYMVGITRDDLDVPYVEVYRIEKPENYR